MCLQCPLRMKSDIPLSLCSPCLSWYGDPRDPPAGLDLPTNSRRKYYNGFTKVRRTFRHQCIYLVSKAARALRMPKALIAGEL